MPAEAAQLLAQLRNPAFQAVDDSFVETSPLPQDSFEQAAFATSLRACLSDLLTARPLRGKILGFDLDETLICNVGESDLGDEMPLYPSYRYSRMRPSLSRLLRYLLGQLARHSAYSPERYPFLANPLHYVRLRAGLFEVLGLLRELGARLVLLTASSAHRLRFLFQRLDWLEGLFIEEGKRQVIAAEDMLEVLLDPERCDCEASQRALTHRPRSLAAKPPCLVKEKLGLADLDLLVDDSALTQEVYAEAGLKDRYLKVDAKTDSLDYTRGLLADLLERLGFSATALRQLKLEAAKPAPAVLDPYYLPLAHVSDQLPRYA